VWTPTFDKFDSVKSCIIFEKNLYCLTLIAQLAEISNNYCDKYIIAKHAILLLYAEVTRKPKRHLNNDNNNV